jgi:hypothetical protein
MANEFTPYALIPNTASEFKRRSEQQYPYLQDKNLRVAYNPDRKQGMLEFYPPQEVGSEQYPRPEQFPIDKFGVDIRSPMTRPIDVLGDYVSHYGIYTDPVLMASYKEIEKSLTGEQKDFLKRQYEDYKRGYFINESGDKVSLGEKEKGTFEEWLDRSGLPGFYRGNIFNQWEDKYYTPRQLELFKKAKQYLGVDD